MEELNKENYHSVEMRKKYMGYSQYKTFCECEVKALAMVNGEYEEPMTEGMLFGSYVDAYFSDELNEFVASHPEMFNSKTGELKAPYKNIEKVIATYENCEASRKAWDGEHQVIETAEIEGVLTKIKIDSLFPKKAIFDGKVVKSIYGPVWVEKTDEETGEKYNVKTNFIEAYRYDLEGAFYQTVHEKVSGDKLPFILNVVSKEEEPDKELIQIDQEIIDSALNEIKQNIQRYDRIKKGLIEPLGCGNCPVCRAKKNITGVKSYKKLFNK